MATSCFRHLNVIYEKYFRRVTNSRSRISFILSTACKITSGPISLVSSTSNQPTGNLHLLSYHIRSRIHTMSSICWDGNYYYYRPIQLTVNDHLRSQSFLRRSPEISHKLSTSVGYNKYRSPVKPYYLFNMQFSTISSRISSSIRKEMG